MVIKRVVARPDCRPGNCPDPAGACRTIGSLVLAVFLVAVRAGAADPSQVFAKNCAPCHSKDGKAQTPMARKLGVKDLSLSKLTDEQIIQTILEGRSDKKKPSSSMPAFKDKLTQEEIRELVKIIQGFRK